MYGDSQRPPTEDQRLGTVVSGSMAGSLSTAVGKTQLAFASKDGFPTVKIQCAYMSLQCYV